MFNRQSVSVALYFLIIPALALSFLMGLALSVCYTLITCCQ